MIIFQDDRLIMIIKSGGICNMTLWCEGCPIYEQCYIILNHPRYSLFKKYSKIYDVAIKEYIRIYSKEELMECML